MNDREIEVETVSYAGQDGPIRARLAKPKGAAAGPAILIGMEAFGWADHILDLTERFARAGYTTLMPDLYSNDPARAELTVAEIEAVLPLSRLPAEEADAEIARRPAADQPALKKAMAWRRKMATVTSYGPDFAAGLAYLKSRPEVDPRRVAAIGYCMGGGLVAELAASGADLAAAIVYYGRLPDGARVGAIKAPVQGHFGALDAGVNASIPSFEAGMKAAGKRFDKFVHEGAHHAFFNDTRTSFHPQASKTAWDATLAFLSETTAA